MSFDLLKSEVLARKSFAFEVGARSRANLTNENYFCFLLFIYLFNFYFTTLLACCFVTGLQAFVLASIEKINN